VTMEKVLDGYPPIYCLATTGATSPSLSGRANIKSTIGLSIYTDSQNSASGTPIAQCTMSGVFPSALAWSIPTQGNATESVTLVGNNKIWTNAFTATAFNDADLPLAPEGVNRRQNIIFGGGASGCLLPTDLPGVSGDGTNNLQADGSYSCHLQSIKVSTNLGREALYELGHRNVYFRYVNFPVPVQSVFEMIASNGDNMIALENANSNVNYQTIKIFMTEGTKLDLGTKNKCESVTYTGGNAAQNGGNVSQTFSYKGFNSLTVTHPQDPSGL
jgi:hypothetical protein